MSGKPADRVYNMRSRQSLNGNKEVTAPKNKDKAVRPVTTPPVVQPRQVDQGEDDPIETEATVTRNVKRNRTNKDETQAIMNEVALQVLNPPKVLSDTPETSGTKGLVPNSPNVKDS